MALIDGNVSYTLLDDLGTKVPNPIYFQVDDSNTMVDIIAAALAMGTFEDAVTGSQIVDTSIKFRVTDAIPGAKSAPVAGSRNNQLANFVETQAGITDQYTQVVPALRDTLIVNEAINNAATAVTNFTGELVTPSGVLAWASNTFRDLTAWTASYISFRKHRKQNIGKSKRTV